MPKLKALNNATTTLVYKIDVYLSINQQKSHLKKNTFKLLTDVKVVKLGYNEMEVVYR